jgi:uncharacterized protein YggU (UPF0235/DUF167 family)
LTTEAQRHRENLSLWVWFFLCASVLNLLKVPRSSVTIASGQTTRQKVIRVLGLSAEEVGRRIV